MLWRGEDLNHHTDKGIRVLRYYIRQLTCDCMIRYIYLWYMYILVGCHWLEWLKSVKIWLTDRRSSILRYLLLTLPLVKLSLLSRWYPMLWRQFRNKLKVSNSIFLCFVLFSFSGFSLKGSWIFSVLLLLLFLMIII